MIKLRKERNRIQHAYTHKHTYFNKQNQVVLTTIFLIQLKICIQFEEFS